MTKLDPPVSAQERYLYAVVERLDEVIKLINGMYPPAEIIPDTAGPIDKPTPKRKTSKKEG